MKLESIALHHGYDSDKNDQKSATTPIYQTSGFTIDNTKHGADLFDLKVEGNIYTRIGNPTNDVLEKRVAEMEGGIAALSLASGKRVEIRGFGSFSLRYRAPRLGRNPKTGESVGLPSKYVPHVKPGKILRDKVNKFSSE